MSQNVKEVKVEKKFKMKSWKIIVPVVISVILVISLVGINLLLSQNVGPKTWTVDDDGPADFWSIKGAINAARDGDTILVKAGTYKESDINLMKALTLSGENKSTTIIDGQGLPGAVIEIQTSNVNLSGFTIRNGTWGIFLAGSRCIVRDNIIVSNVGESGIDLNNFNNTVSDNTIESNTRGIRLSYASNNDIRNNTILNNEYGVDLFYDSPNNTFSGNIVMNNSLYGFYSYSRVGYIPCDNNTFIGNTIIDNLKGVLLEECDNLIFINNTISNNTEFGVDLWGSVNFVGNTLSNNGDYDVKIYGIDGNNISKNIFAESEEGIGLYHSSNNTITENIFLYNQYAINLFWGDYNIVCNNTILNNTNGIQTYFSDSNIIYHNNFVNNTVQVLTTYSTSTWDNGYPSGGNYWSDHVCTGNPSNGSQPYTIDADNIDHYPFQDPIT